jgi:hypothetical protein
LRITVWDGGALVASGCVVLITAAVIFVVGFLTAASVVATTERLALSPSTTDLEVR